MNEDRDPNHVEATTGVVGQNPPWKAKTVWVAVLLVVFGAFFWIKDASQKPPPSSSPSTPGMRSFSDSTSATDPGAARTSEMKPTSPATFRLGVSYLGGFFLGWALRRFIKATLLLSGAAVLLIGLGKKLGWIDLDWASIEGHVNQSLAWLQGEAGAIKQFLTGYLPSAGAAGTGVFLGFRRK
jgi:uncharacterized membrane protein (Fun14 family)